MTKPALIPQEEIARAIRAAKKAGWTEVRVEMNGLAVEIRLAKPAPPAPAAPPEPRPAKSYYTPPEPHREPGAEAADIVLELLRKGPATTVQMARALEWKGFARSFLGDLLCAMSPIKDDIVRVRRGLYALNDTPPAAKPWTPTLVEAAILSLLRESDPNPRKAKQIADALKPQGTTRAQVDKALWSMSQENGPVLRLASFYSLTDAGRGSSS